jgi:hypothetical protein
VDTTICVPNTAPALATESLQAWHPVNPVAEVAVAVATAATRQTATGTRFTMRGRGILVPVVFSLCTGLLQLGLIEYINMETDRIVRGGPRRSFSESETPKSEDSAP